MRTRDTIVIAVLINMGLLAILFATARGSGGDMEMVAAAEPIVAPVEKIEQAPAPMARDEIDQALAHYREAKEEKSVAPAAIAPPKPKPEPKVEEPKKQQAGRVEIVVKKGDSLDKIARANSTTIDRLVEVNRLKTTKLQIGQKLEVPTGPRAVAAAPKKSETTSSQEYYTVQSGDSPWLIANRLRIPLDELLRLNSLDERSAKRLKPGDQIRIR